MTDVAEQQIDIKMRMQARINKLEEENAVLEGQVKVLRGTLVQALLAKDRNPALYPDAAYGGSIPITPTKTSAASVKLAQEIANIQAESTYKTLSGSA